MGHMSSYSYRELQKRIDESVQGAPSSRKLRRIFETIFSEKEAKLISVLPLFLFTAKEAAELWEVSTGTARKYLDDLAVKGVVLDLKSRRKHMYFLLPPLAGFFEMTMYGGKKYDEDELSRNFYDYLTKGNRFMNELLKVDPIPGRIYVQTGALDDKQKKEIKDYEKAENVIDTAYSIGLGICYCRHKMEHLGKKCRHEQMNCLTFNEGAESFIRHGLAKKITKTQAKKILQDAEKNGLVQFGESVQDNALFICNCCDCCCEALNAYKRFGHRGIQHSNFRAVINNETCIKCGLCTRICPVRAISDRPKVSIHDCLGCGVCVQKCPTNSISLEKTPTKFIPKDPFERMIFEAIDKGELQNYIFDNHKLWTHRMLKRLSGVLFRKETIKKVLKKNKIESILLRLAMKTEKYHRYQEFVLKNKKEDYSHPEMRKTN